MKVVKKINEPVWEREEVILLVENYFRTKYLPSYKIDEEILGLSKFLKYRYEKINGQTASETFRNFAGVRMQTARIRCLDPDTDLHGMQGTRLQKEIVEEYLVNKNIIIEEANVIYKKYYSDKYRI
ncbi:hypothetical protein H0486_03190 [Lachnospiraceae bacterium MD1]|uniref:Uncharacterized protein n=1 Tax=Variimorphobacter saccharofermentans TaxID=2755051 RepID=A0A839JXC4_9FIRM|nr:hypothetical protein [Variimorphobacter saccharofermentans]MBB2181877.1 hypothetical protein [Variimorphobacter saccharofermentans]